MVTMGYLVRLANPISGSDVLTFKTLDPLLFQCPYNVIMIKMGVMFLGHKTSVPLKIMFIKFNQCVGCSGLQNIGPTTIVSKVGPMFYRSERPTHRLNLPCIMIKSLKWVEWISRFGSCKKCHKYVKLISHEYMCKK